MKDKAAAATEEAQKGISVHQFSLELSADSGVVFGQVVKYGEQCDQVWSFVEVPTGYRVIHLVLHLGWIDFDLDVPPSCLAVQPFRTNCCYVAHAEVNT